MNTPLISLIIPVYRVESYLEKCLDSILNQTYHNLEIIIVDDGSPDNCGVICDKYASTDSRIQVIHQENAGISSARNRGLDIAKGEFILFVDSDDWIEPETCEYLLNLACERQADIVCFGYYEVFLDGRKDPHSVKEPGMMSKDELIRHLVWGTGAIQTMVWNKLYSARIFDNIRFAEGRIHEDIEIMYKLVFEAERIFSTDALLYYYFQRKQGAITTDVLQPKSIIDRIYAHKERLQFVEVHYPELIEKQLTATLRLILLGLEVLKGESNFMEFKADCYEFIGRYRRKIKNITAYSRLIWLYYYCKPLVPLYIKWLRFSNYDFNKF